MKLYVNWRSSLKAIFKNKKRSILTMFGIVIGIAAVIAILAIGRGFEKQTIQSLTQNDSEEVTVTINYSPNDYAMYEANIPFFSDNDLQLLRNLEGVDKAEFQKYESDDIYQDFKIKGKSQNKAVKLVAKTDQDTYLGRELTRFDNDTLNKVALLDSITAEAIFGSDEAALDQGVEIGGQLYQIVGIFTGTEQTSMFAMPESNIFVPKKAYKQFSPEQQDASAVELTLSRGTDPGEVTTSAIDELESNGSTKDQGSYQAFDSAILTEGIGQVFSTITYFISAVAGISLFIAGVGVMNMMYISVSERTKEIGIRRAMGATRGAIRTQFLLEGMTLTLVGGIIGYVLGMILAYTVGGFMDLPITVDFTTVALAVGVSSGIGLVFSVMPASEAAKKDLIDILR